MYSKRTSRLTADITLDTHNLLREACKKYDAPKGKLLERMIINFCGDAKPAHEKPSRGIIVETSIEKPKPVKRFVPPTVVEVWGYMIEKGCKPDTQCTEAHKFCDHFQSNGWKVGGKTKMVSWKAAVRTWIKNNASGQSRMYGKPAGKTSGNLSACEAFING